MKDGHPGKIFWALTIVLGFVLQMVSSEMISILGSFPNLLLLGTIFYAIRYGPLAGAWIGFVWGLFADVASITIFGSQTFVFTLVGYCTGRLQGKIDEEKTVAQLGLVLTMFVVHFLGLLILEILFAGTVQRFSAKTSWIQPLYSTLVCPVVFFVLFKWQDWFQRANFRGGRF